MFRLWVQIVVASLATGAVATADPRGEELLRKMDAGLTRSKDQIFLFDMIVQDPGAEPRTMSLRVHSAGERRRVEFVHPGDVKGLKILIRSRDQMHVYLPAYGKVRRIASHMRAQSLFGSDYSYDEMSTATYSGTYRGTFVKETKEHVIVRGDRRSEDASPYARIDFHLRKKELLPDRLEYFSSAGKKVKTETRADFRCFGAYCTAAKMKIVDHEKSDHWTEMIAKEIKVDIGLADTDFSLRWLQRAQ